MPVENQPSNLDGGRGIRLPTKTLPRNWIKLEEVRSAYVVGSADQSYFVFTRICNAVNHREKITARRLAFIASIYANSLICRYTNFFKWLLSN